MTNHYFFKASRTLASFVVALVLCAPVAFSQPIWPDKPVRIIVPYAAGQGADVLARLIAQDLQKTLGQPIIVENKAGAGGNIGTAAVAKSAADGYTFLLGTNATNAANEFLYPSMGFSPATDFEPVALIGVLPSVISTSLPSLPTNGIRELISQAKAKPDTLNVGLTSTTANVVFAQFVRTAQAPLFGVKYKSSGQAMTDVIGEQIPLVIDTVIASRPHIASGKLKALGLTSKKASDVLPGVKPIAEQGVPGFDLVGWDGLFAPKGTPANIVQKMGEHLRRAMDQPEMQKRLIDIGVEPQFMNASEFDAFVKGERTKWGGIIKSANISLE